MPTPLRADVSSNSKTTCKTQLLKTGLNGKDKTRRSPIHVGDRRGSFVIHVAEVMRLDAASLGLSPAEYLTLTNHPAQA